MNPLEIAEIAGRSLLVGAVATALIIPPGLALAWLLARRDFRGRALVQTLLALPLVLPPTAIGLLLLLLLSPQQPWAAWLHALLGGNPLFTWRAAVIASAFMGAPLLVRTAETAFAAVEPAYEQLASMLGASTLRVFFSVTLPLAARGVAYAILLAFLRGVGEFGATSLIAGNIPGETETLALAIYSRAQNHADRDALLLALVAVGIALLATWLGERLLRPATRPHAPPLASD